MKIVVLNKKVQNQSIPSGILRLWDLTVFILQLMLMMNNKKEKNLEKNFNNQKHLSSALRVCSSDGTKGIKF